MKTEGIQNYVDVITSHCVPLFSSVLCADIVSFTETSSSMLPQELVAMLNDVFARFDNMAQVRCHNNTTNVTKHCCKVQGTEMEKVEVLFLSRKMN